MFFIGGNIMALINLINDCIKEFGKQDVESCKQTIINEAQAEINLIFSSPYLSDGEKFYRANRIKQIADELLLQQKRRDFLLDAAVFLNELSKACENNKK